MTRTPPQDAPQIVTRPLISLSIVFTLGVLFGPAEHPAVMIALLVALSVLCAVLGARRRIAASFIAPAPFYLLGLLVSNYRLPPHQTLSAQPARLGVPGVLIEGIVAEVPERANGGWRLIIDLAGTSTAPVQPLEPAEGRARIEMRDDSEDGGASCGEPGDRVRMFAELDRLRAPDKLSRRTRRPAVLRGVELAGPANACTVIAPRPRGAFDRLRNAIGEAIDRDGPHEIAPLLRELTLGDDARTAASARRGASGGGSLPGGSPGAFRTSSAGPASGLTAAGLGQLFCLGGIELAFLFGAILLAVRAVLRRIPAVALGIGARRLTAIFMLPMLAILIGLFGATPSILRTSLTLAVLLSPILLGRAPDPWSALGLALIVVLFWDPSALGDISFSLAFVAVSAIFRVGQLLERAVLERFAPAKWAIASGAYAAGVAIATAPLIARRFPHVSLASLLADAIAIPAVAAFSTPLAWIGGALGSRPILEAAASGISLVTALAGATTRLGPDAIRIPTPTVLECVLFYLGTVLASARQGRARLAGLGLGLLAIGSAILRSVSS